MYICTPIQKNLVLKEKIIKMTKADIIKEIAETTGVNRRDVSATVEAFMEVVKRNLLNEESVYLRGFGSFIVKHRKAKTARNISKNTAIVIEAHNYPGFKPSKSFAEEMKANSSK